jgi:nucleotide-binding universal stress UspA family protein
VVQEVRALARAELTTMPGRIVVGVDGSPSSITALRWAIARATVEDRPVPLPLRAA